MLNVDIPRKYMFSDEMVVHINVLCLSMQVWVLSKMYIADIVALDQD